MTYATYTPEQVEAIFASIPQEVVKAMKTSFNTQSKNCLRREVAMELTFEQWAAIWWDSGKWEVRGRTKDKPYQMCRKNDEGSYSMGNVRIDTIRANLAEADNPIIGVSSAMTQKWQDPSFRKIRGTAISKANQSRVRSPEELQLLTQIMKDKWQDQEFRDKMKEVNKNTNAANLSAVRSTDRTTGEVREWPSIAEAARHFGQSKGNISNAAAGKIKSSANQRWEYI